MQEYNTECSSSSPSITFFSPQNIVQIGFSITTIPSMCCNYKLYNIIQCCYFTTLYIIILCRANVIVLIIFILTYAYLPDTGSKLMILFIRSVDKTTLSNSATLPLDKLVLPACGHTAILLSLQYFSMSDTSSAVFGLNTSPLSPVHTHTSIKHHNNNNDENNNNNNNNNDDDIVNIMKTIIKNKYNILYCIHQHARHYCIWPLSTFSSKCM